MAQHVAGPNTYSLICGKQKEKHFQKQADMDLLGQSQTRRCPELTSNSNHSVILW